MRAGVGVGVGVEEGEVEGEVKDRVLESSSSGYYQSIYIFMKWMDVT